MVNEFAHKNELALNHSTGSTHGAGLVGQL